MEREVTMREKLAQAIRKDVMAQQKTRGGVIDWSSVADAALNALEEPAADIVAAGLRDANRRLAETSGYAVNVVDFHRAMIQAIREGK